MVYVPYRLYLEDRLDLDLNIKSRGVLSSGIEGRGGQLLISRANCSLLANLNRTPALNTQNPGGGDKKRQQKGQSGDFYSLQTELLMEDSPQ